MNRGFIIILTALILVGCAAQKDKSSYKRIISQKYLTSDSLSIHISYDLIPSCTELYPNHLSIQISGNQTYIFNKPYESETERIGPIKENIITDIVKFEKEAKTNRTLCGGYVGGNGINVTMKINGEETTFEYCKDKWDGIGELLSLMRAKYKN